MAESDTSTLRAESALWPRAQTAEAAVPDRTRLLALDALRGLMALSVAVYHLSVWTHALEGRARELAIVLGIYSVQGFFLISGLCFFKLYGRVHFGRAQLRSFYLRRFLRIAPLFYVAIALNYALGTPVDPRSSPWRLLENLTLTFGLFHPNHAWVIGGWSIGIECLFYAAFPALAWLTRRRGVLYALIPLAIACALPYTFGKVAAAATPAQFNMYVRVPNHAFLFLLGGAIADLLERTRVRIPLLAAVAVSGGLGFWVLRGQSEIVDHVEVMLDFARVRYVLLCTAVVALWAFARNTQGWVAWLLGRLGDLSYATYLMHPFAWFAASRWLPAGMSPLGQLLCGLGATLVLAAVAHRVIERPAIALGRRLSTAE